MPRMVMILMGWLLVASTTLRADVDLGPLLSAADKSIWDMGPEDFIGLDPQKKTFVWNDNTKTSLCFNPRYSKGVVTLSDISVNEMRIYFEDGKAVKLEANIFNRADNDELDKATFRQGLENIENTCGKLSKVEGSRKSTSLLDGSYIYSRFWQNGHYRLIMRWGSSGGSSKTTFQPEFVSLLITPPEGEKDSKEALKVDKNAVANLRNKVKRLANGDRFLTVPMVDQGEKSYCVNAACERVLKYYGSDVDQHVLAQLAKSSAVGGTNMDQMLKSLQRAGAKLHFRCRELYVYKDLMSESGINHMIAAYNIAAGREKRKKLNTSPEYWQYDASNVLAALEPDLFRAVRIKERDFKDFQRQVRENINNGTPILWGVLLGIVKEKDLPQLNGGHLRLIIGYNEKDGQVIYSDSWGKEHAFKKMSWEDAWTMTTMVITCIPRQNR